MFKISMIIGNTITIVWFTYEYHPNNTLIYYTRNNGNDPNRYSRFIINFKIFVN